MVNMLRPRQFSQPVTGSTHIHGRDSNKFYDITGNTVTRCCTPAHSCALPLAKTSYILKPEDAVGELSNPDWAFVDCRFALNDPNRGLEDYKTKP
jgi:hypothetical protein